MRPFQASVDKVQFVVSRKVRPQTPDIVRSTSTDCLLKCGNLDRKHVLHHFPQPCREKKITLHKVRTVACGLECSKLLVLHTSVSSSNSLLDDSLCFLQCLCKHCGPTHSIEEVRGVADVHESSVSFISGSAREFGHQRGGRVVEPPGRRPGVRDEHQPERLLGTNATSEGNAGIKSEHSSHSNCT